MHYNNKQLFMRGFVNSQKIVSNYKIVTSFLGNINTFTYSSCNFYYKYNFYETVKNHKEKYTRAISIANICHFNSKFPKYSIETDD